MHETFRCIDPRDREIVLWDLRWYDKIIDPKRGRPQLAGLLDDIKLTLMQPELINEDKGRAGVEVYYRSNIVVPPPYGRSMLKICVLFSEDEWGTLSAVCSRSIPWTSRTPWSDRYGRRKATSDPPVSPADGA
jgi:hypothetical protein